MNGVTHDLREKANEPNVSWILSKHIIAKKAKKTEEVTTDLQTKKETQ